MNSIWNKFFLILIILFTTYSQGRYVSAWSKTSDRSLIDECLRKSLKYINRMEDSQVTISDVSKIVCKTQFYNGLNIKLTFQLHEQRWECSLYKSLIQILSVQYEKCVKIDKENLPEEIPKNENSNANNDEAKIDKLRQDVHKQDNADEAKKQVHNEETNQNLDNKQSNDEDEENNDEEEYGDEKISDSKANNKENVNNDEQDDDEYKGEAPNDNGEDEQSKQNLENQQKGHIDEVDNEENIDNARALEVNADHDPEDEE
jgi:hypothetical protein